MEEKDDIEGWVCPFCGVEIPVISPEQIEDQASEHLHSHYQDEISNDVDDALGNLRMCIIANCKD